MSNQLSVGGVQYMIAALRSFFALPQVVVCLLLKITLILLFFFCLEFDGSSGRGMASQFTERNTQFFR
jgi:hypothetical protein